MARTIILELTDEQEQQLLRQAEKLNLPIESVLLRPITHPLPSLSYSEEDLLRFFLLSDLFNTIRAARLVGQTTTEVPATETTTNLLHILKGGALITDFQPIERDQQHYLLLHLTIDGDRGTAFRTLSDEPELSLSKEFTAILKDLDHEDPQIREQAVIALGEFGRDSQ
ncbi:MAG: hypothetical protein MUF49_27115 [Oculatellaceae cyanobacterium Prado106]|jgi:ribosomal protein S8|nr:hypothetical protein [Oculatellaceae cyanobacterium Prado106]